MKRVNIFRFLLFFQTVLKDLHLPKETTLFLLAPGYCQATESAGPSRIPDSPRYAIMASELLTRGSKGISVMVFLAASKLSQCSNENVNVQDHTKLAWIL